MDHIVRTSSLVLILVVLVVVLLGSTEIGRRLGRQRRGNVEDKDASTLATGMLGIFALLIAFTYSLTLSRYDARRAEVLQEANAIGTTVNYATMLPGQVRDVVIGHLRDYAQQRILLGSPYDQPRFGRDVARSNAVLATIWSEASNLTAADPQSLPAYRFVSALNEQTNIAEARITALRNHVPIVVLAVLVLVAMVSLGLAGYAASLGGLDRHFGLGIMAVTIAILIALVIDLDRPNRGLIEISIQPLIDAAAAIPNG